MTMLLLSLLSSLVLLTPFTLCDEFMINSVSEFIEFSNNVATGTNYTGSTVLLSSDLDFSFNHLEPIGDEANYFLGTFDGQGHVISGITINSTLDNVGLFGYSEGITIRNLVFDKSVSIDNNPRYESAPAVGSALGLCVSDKDFCTVANCVSMGKVSFGGNISGSLGLGGIVGVVSGDRYEIFMSNCANYGTLSNNGNAEGGAWIGGIIGVCSWDEHLKSIQNCLNYGTIESTDLQTGDLQIGGIAGATMKTALTNCMSGGKIVTASKSDIGGLVGFLYSKTNATNCYWTNESWGGDSYGAENPNVPFIGTNSSKITSSTEALDELNRYVTPENKWSKWFTLHLNGGRINDLEEDTLIVIEKFFSEPVMLENTFAFWCGDVNCNAKYDPKTSSLSDTTELYAVWNTVTVIFDGNGGSVSETSRKVAYNSTYGALPVPTKKGHRFVGWFTAPSGGVEISETTRHTYIMDVTAYAQWKINNYTISFESNGGTEVYSLTQEYGMPISLPVPSKNGYKFDCWCNDSSLSNEFVDSKMPADNVTLYAKFVANQHTITFIFDNGADPEVRILNFNALVQYPKGVEKEGFTFNGWDVVISFMPDNDTTITAQWIEKPTQYVEIVLAKKDVTEDEIREIIKSYVDGAGKYTIEPFAVDPVTGETRVVIKFSDPAKSEEFVHNINENRKLEDRFIKSANCFSRDSSFSPISYPSLLSIVILG